MATYAGLKLKVNNPQKEMDFQGNKINVSTYLPIEDKYDLIEITLQKSRDDSGYYNPVKLDEYFHLHLVYLYTDLSFTDKQREDEDKIYNCLKSNGFIDKLLEIIPEEEYNELYDYLQERIDGEIRYTTTFAAILKQIIGDLPKSAAAAQEIVENFDPEKYQAVLDFAKAANGGRDI